MKEMLNWLRPLIAPGDEQSADCIPDPRSRARLLGFVIARVLLEEGGVGELLKEAG